MTRYYKKIKGKFPCNKKVHLEVLAKLATQLTALFPSLKVCLNWILLNFIVGVNMSLKVLISCQGGGFLLLITSISHNPHRCELSFFEVHN